MKNMSRYFSWLPLIFLSPALAQDSVRTPQAKADVARDLNEVARIATTMVDGDLCGKIMTRRSLEKMFVVDPKDPWTAGDNFDVNSEPYITVKKTLIRLSRLVPYKCDVNLWMPFRDQPDKIQVLIRNVNEWSQFWTWGKLAQDIPPEMKRVLESGKQEEVNKVPGMVSILAPVYDSMGDVVALVEVVAFEPGAKAPQVHARLRGQSPVSQLAHALIW